MRSPLPRPAPVAMAAAALLAASCTTGGDAGSPSPSPTPEPGEVEIPDTPVGEQIRWTLDQLAADDGPDPAEVETRFAGTFLDQVGPEELAGVFDQLRAEGPWTATGVTGETHAAEVGLRTGDGGAWMMTISLDGDGLIGGLFFGPDAVADRAAAESFDALTDELAGLADRAGFLAARVGGDGCVPVATREADTGLPLGSVFKLYVLGALADAVAAGTVSWDDPVTLIEAHRSLPSGRLQDQPAGTEVTVREAARDMIAISDNTATDLLIDLLGRDPVEEAVAAMGHADPARLVPFPTTREFFQIGWGDPQWRRQWADGDRAARAGLLAELASVPLEVPPGEVATPVWQDGVDWFASPEDVCAAYLALQERAAGPEGEPVREILSAKAGIALDPGTWPYVGFKGGSAPGTLSGAWYAEHADGGAAVVVFQLASTQPVDQRLAFAIAADAFTLLAAQPD